MDLRIRYEKGTMTVHLEQFMACRNITGVKKLIRLIRSGYTPECLNQMEEWVRDHIRSDEEFRACMRVIANAGVEARTKERELEVTLDEAVFFRSQCRRKSLKWAEWNDEIKRLRDEIRMNSSVYRDALRKITFAEREREFLKKVLEVIIQGG